MSALFCTKCGRVADTAKHAGCDYLAVRVSWPQTDTLTQIEEAEKRGEIAPIRRYVPSPDDSTQAVPATAPTPHSDSLDLEGIRRTLVATENLAPLTYLEKQIPALLSRLEAAEREALYHRTVVGTDIVLPIHHSAYVPVLEAEISRLRSENARMAEVLEAARLNVCTVPETCRNPLCAAFRKYDDYTRRAASPDANREENAKP